MKIPIVQSFRGSFFAFFDEEEIKLGALVLGELAPEVCLGFLDNLPESYVQKNGGRADKDNSD